ncbi:hypothetical protein D9758_014250 [Tetrapyrgos nigripes]|uniref:Uncharacterized protein n=1 Tax=Tetrapyrgos nigripes TaxID=182062 RepID=A0A8H5CCK9_9AGAR|nr:hypothetical protein D9758_014250 [Tetrapyrgos nigripes]
MSLQHRVLHARQIFPGNSAQDPPSGNGADSELSPSSASNSGVSSPSAPAPSTTPSAQPPAPSELSTRPEPSVPTTPSPVPPSITSSSATSSSSSSSSATSSSTSSTQSSSLTSSSARTTSSTTSSTSSAPRSTSSSTSTTLVPTVPQTSSFNTIRRTSSTAAAAATISASETPVSQSGGINTGAVAGGIAGGLVALAFLGFIVAFFLRRRNKRRREEKFNAMQFRKSAMVMYDDEFAPMPRPPEMIQNRMNVVPSTGSIVGAGMAGAGAYKFQNAQDIEEQYHSNTPRAVEYGYAAQPAGDNQHQPLQPRQQHTFGQAYEPSSSAGGVYDSEHHGVYDPTYTSQHAYSGQHAYSSAAPNRNSVATVADDAYGGI